MKLKPPEKLIAKADYIISRPDPRNKACCEAFMYEPANIEEQSFGNLYIIGELSEDLEKKKRPSYLLNLIASQIKREYYSHTKKDPLTSLENALKRANSLLADFTKEKDADWLGRLHFIIASISNNNIYLTQSGAAKSFLLRGNSMIDIGRHLLQSGKDPQPMKTFLSVVSGRLEEKDKLFLATPVVFKSFSREFIRQTFNKFPFEKAVAFLRDALKPGKESRPMGAFILEISKEDENSARINSYPMSMEAARQKKTDLSIKAIVNENRMNEQIIKPGLKLGQKHQTKLKFINANRIKNASIYAIKKIKTQAENIKTAGANALPVLKKVFNRMPSIKTPKAILPLMDKFKRAHFNIPLGALSKIKPKNAKILLSHWKITTAAGIAIAVISLSVFSIGNNSRKQDEITDNTNNMLQKAIEKEKQADNALIYKDTEKALRLLAEANNLINSSVSAETKSDEAEKIRASILTKLDNLTNTARIQEPELVYTLTKGTLSFDPNGIIVLGNYLIAYNSKMLMRVHLKAGEENYVFPPLIEKVKLELASPSQNGESLFLKAGEDKILRYDIIDNSFKTYVIKEPNPESYFVSIAEYSGNIYALDKGAGQIVKYRKIGSGYDSPQIWLQDSELNDLINGVSIAVNGRIYALGNDGSVTSFTTKKDKKTFFILTNPPLKNPSKIITAQKSENLYILDPDGKRIIITSAEGETLQQYIFSSLEEIKDAYLDSLNKTLYILDGMKVYKIGI